MKSVKKRPISWHQENLKQLQYTRYKQEKVMEGQLKEIERLKNDIDFLRLQINTAIIKGKDSFDSERYLVKRKSGDG